LSKSVDLDQSLVELWSKYRLQHSALALAQRKSKSKSEITPTVTAAIKESYGWSSWYAEGAEAARYV